MTGGMLSKSALQIVVLLALNEVCGLAAPPNAPEPQEVVAAPLPQSPLPSGLQSGYAEPDRVLRLPAVAENPQPPRFSRPSQPSPIGHCPSIWQRRFACRMPGR